MNYIATLDKLLYMRPLILRSSAVELSSPNPRRTSQPQQILRRGVSSLDKITPRWPHCKYCANFFNKNKPLKDDSKKNSMLPYYLHRVFKSRREFHRLKFSTETSQFNS